VTAVALRKDTIAERSALSRREVLTRYRRLREISKRHHSEVLQFLSGDWILHNARRLGLAHGRTIMLDHEDDLNFAFDLAIYTAPKGRSRAVDRYAKSAKLAPGSDEALVLAAMQQARFSVICIERRHEAAGLVVHDMFRRKDIWLVDEGLESSLPDGSLLATRLYTPDRFSVTAGVLVPLDTVELLYDVLIDVPQLGRKQVSDAVDDRRFAEAVYRLALEEGIMEGVAFRDPGVDAE